MEKNIIYKIVQASGVKKGELILIHFWGEDKDKHIANDFCQVVVELGASPILLQQSRTINRDIFSSAQETCFNEKYFDLFHSFDAVLDIFTYQPIILGYEIEENQHKLYRKYMKELFSKLIEIERFAQIRIPTRENTKETDLEVEDYMNRMISAYDIDYLELKHSCEIMKNQLEKSNSLVLHTGDGCKLHLKLNDREWYIDAGDGDIPCGEVYIAPIENETQGKIFFEELFIEDIGKFSNVIFEIKNGQIIDSNNKEVNVFLDSLMENEKIVCEFGIGMNPNIHSLCGYTVLDEKMKGTFHIAIGANTMFGGKNNAPNHIDLVGVGKIEYAKQSYQ